ncbi:polysaccharide deacetylase family protein [Patescibacteria group bacterium]
MSEEKNKGEKKSRLFFDLVIAGLIIIVVILIDLFVISLKSSPAEIFGLGLQKNDDNQKTEETYSGFKEITEDVVFIPILNFHHIDQAPAGVGRITKTYYIEPADFENTIIDLIAADYEFVFVSEIIDFIKQDKLPVKQILAITFDDGNKNFYTNAWPILQKHKVKSSVYVMTGVGGNNYLNDQEIVELSASGLVEIGSHTIWHPKLTKISADERLKELEISKDDLDSLLNKNINVIAYPFGLYNEEIKSLAQAVGYEAGLTFDQDAWQMTDDLMELKRISVYPDLNVIKFLDKLKIQ